MNVLGRMPMTLAITYGAWSFRDRRRVVRVARGHEESATDRRAVWVGSVHAQSGRARSTVDSRRGGDLRRRHPSYGREGS
jgi:hypothetical protein